MGKQADADQGESEGLPFSREVLVLFQKLQRATSKEERRQLMLELSERFASEYDSADATATDDYHVYFEALAQAKLAHEQAAMKVGRLATEVIKTYLASTSSEVPIEDVAVEQTKSLN